MADNRLRKLQTLPDDVLAEVIREGEMRLLGQFQAAAASDQRALTWSGLLITIAIAAIGAAATLYVSGRYYLLTLVSLLFSSMISIAAFMAIDCVRPKGFHFPGNLPENWLPEEWQGFPGIKHDLRQARLEQSVCLNQAIKQNAALAEQSGSRLRRSMDIALFSILFAAIVGGAALFVEKYI